MAYTPFSTHQLLGVIERVRPTNAFWLDNAFTREVIFEDEFIDFDRIEGDKRIAPFVAPTASGKPMRSKGYTTTRFKPAYLKPMHPVDPSRLLTRRAGEPFTGTLSPQQRRNAIIASLVIEQRDMIRRRWEVMAAHAVIDGKITVSGEDYPTQVVDFGRDPAATITLTGTDLWTDTSNSDIEGQLEQWGLDMSDRSGYAPNVLVMGRNAWSAFKKHPKVEKLLDTNFRGGSDSINRSIVMPENDYIASLRGYIGNVAVVVYHDTYVDESGATQSVLSPDTVVGYNTAGIMGHRAFGAILDVGAQYRALPIYPKNWANENPAVEYVMSQSAPLMIPAEPNASFKAKVV